MHRSPVDSPNKGQWRGALLFVWTNYWNKRWSCRWYEMENIFRVTGPLWGESTGHRWIPPTKASDAELWCFLWCAPEQTVELPVVWDAMMSTWHHCNMDKNIRHQSTTPPQKKKILFCLLTADSSLLDIWPPFPRQQFQMNLHEWKVCILIRISLKFVPKGLIDNKGGIGSGSGLAPKRQQAITWTHGDPVHWRLHASFGRYFQSLIFQLILITEGTKSVPLLT